ncbi:uncharacterized protein A1O9_10528 [Exophiala aquamarina CBS 119918]|uniref:Uncharacterized protein n=1 Tax=Exophiala aquamarina CBS 119918 TaxID=1182545 RepID=A0A072P2Q6_9EURO|nr:uncharacterized protein A1O9_10528 [Exophiala aquamarina CBS 119918]KEF53553.1 hypothetical protein A1O9_10528 [Exophiala aquamarina CBS 119918]
MKKFLAFSTLTRRNRPPQQEYDNIPLSNDVGATTNRERKFKTIIQGSSKESIDDQIGSQRTNTEYNPQILTRPILLIFAFLSAAVVASLQGIYSRSQSNQGITQSNDNLHYLWTYGPTAILILFTVVWRQVDYAVKSLQPWAEMANGPVSAERSLLLDYVTPFQGVVLWRSIFSGHYVITLSITTFFLTKALTIVSTGLLTLQPLRIDSIRTTISYDTIFNGSAFDGGSVVDSRPAYTLYAIQAFNTSYPAGTTDMYAVQQFSQSGNTSDIESYTAITDVFTTSVECEIGSMNYTLGYNTLTDTTPVSSYWNTTVSLPGCEVREASLDAPSWMYNTSDDNPEPNYGYFASFQPVNCSNLANDDREKWRFMVAALHVKGVRQNANEVLEGLGLVCIPKYSIQPATVTSDSFNNVQEVVFSNDTSRQLEGVTDADITNGVESTNQLALNIAINLDLDLRLDGFIELGAAEMNISDMQELLNPDVLELLAKRTYQRLSAQIAHTFLTSPVGGQDDSTSIPATTSQNEFRLVVRQLPTRIMQGLAAAICFLAMTMAFTVPRGVVPRNIDAIAPLAAIIARSPTLQRQLCMVGHLNMEDLRKLLSQYEYRTVMEDRLGTSTFSIQGLSKDATHSEGRHMERSRTLETFQWWRPWVLTRRAMVGCLITPIAAIIGLEITLRQSDKNAGLSDVDAESLTRYAWIYIPTLVFVLIGTLYNTVDFELELSAPYYALSKEYCDAQSSMFYNHFRGFALQSVWLALRKRKFALAAASVSVILSPLLTIVVSGLFLPQATTDITPSELQSLSWFNTTGCEDCDALYTTSKAKSIPGLIIQGNMSYPAWTYDEVALPQLSFSDPELAGGRKTIHMTGTVSLTTSALRAGMNCTLVPNDLLNEVVLNVTDKSLTTNFTYPTCGSDFGDENSRTTIYSYTETPWYLGSVSSLGNDLPCPVWSLTYALINEKDELEQLSVHLCAPSVEMVEVNATFNLPDFSITEAPIVNEDSAILFSDWYDPYPAYGDLNITTGSVSQEFSAMIAGKDGKPITELADSKTLIASYTKLYRVYAAQIFNTDFRSAWDDLPKNQSQANSIPAHQLATLSNPNRVRLFQSKVSTRILQGLLAGLLVCGLFVFFLIDARKVLSKPLGTIAVTATLLASSTLVDEKSGNAPPLGAEWWSDREWEKREVWTDKLFRMGWWYEHESSIITAVGNDENSDDNVIGKSVPEEHMRMTKDFRIDTKPPV